MWAESLECGTAFWTNSVFLESAVGFFGDVLFDLTFFDVLDASGVLSGRKIQRKGAKVAKGSGGKRYWKLGIRIIAGVRLGSKLYKFQKSGSTFEIHGVAHGWCMGRS